MKTTQKSRAQGFLMKTPVLFAFIREENQLEENKNPREDHEQCKVGIKEDKVAGIRDASLNC